MSRRNIISILLMVSGIIFICAAVFLTYYNIQENLEAGSEAVQIVLAMEEQKQTLPVENFAEDSAVEEESVSTALIDGVSYYGYLSIPQLKLELPIAADWKFEQLKKTPCTYSGSPAGNDWVIAGHNYQSHFSPLKALKKGDEILFKNVMGKEIHFIVMETEVLEPVQIKEMTGSDFDLSLFTCTYGGSARYTIRCSRLVE